MSHSTTHPTTTHKPSASPFPVKWAVLSGLGIALVTVLLTGSPRSSEDIDPSTFIPPSQWLELRREYQPVEFSVLGGFEYGQLRGPFGAVLEGSRETIPAEIAQLSGRKVSVSGFMLPLDFNGHGVTEFLLNASYDMCYFGAPTRPNDFVVVRMRDGRRTRFVHTPIVVAGTLEVGEERQNGRVVSLYRMTGDGIGVGAIQ